jgi:prepilin-type N-terminal cleavage/methylation domain-containing protein
MNRRRNAFTLVELLVVALVLSVLLLTALPGYAHSIRSSRHAAANQNAKAVLKAVQALYARLGGIDYADPRIDRVAIQVELGGQIHTNPCTGGNELADYALQRSATSASVQAQAGNVCDPASLPTFRLGG